VLVSRDVLAWLIDGDANVSDDQRGVIETLDVQLKLYAPYICNYFDHKRTSRLHEVFDHVTSHAARLPRSRHSTAAHLVWDLIALNSAGVVISLLVVDAAHVLSTGPDFVAVLLGVLQVVLAFLTLLGALSVTQLFRPFSTLLTARLSLWGLPTLGHRVIRACAAFTVLIVALAVHAMAPPSLAQWFNERALDSQNEGRITSAIEGFKRAIKIAPDYVAAHYGLASALEEVLDFDGAMGEYQRAISTDRSFYQAYNNLARLYIARRGDYPSALQLLNGALEGYPAGQSSDTTTLYSLYKNRGWAYFGMSLLKPAERDLNEALRLNPRGAAAHCLLAQIHESLSSTTVSAIEHWEACVRYAAESTVEATWIALAQERIGERDETR